MKTLRAYYWYYRLQWWMRKHKAPMSESYNHNRDSIYGQACVNIFRSIEKDFDYSPRFEYVNATIEIEDVEYRYKLSLRNIHGSSSLFRI